MRQRNIFAAAFAAGLISTGMVARGQVVDLIRDDDDPQPRPGPPKLVRKAHRRVEKVHTHSREIARRLRQQARAEAKARGESQP